MKKIFKAKLAAMLLTGTFAVSAMSVFTSVANAQYITAFEQQVYEKYVVDTQSIFYPEKHTTDMFNVLVWAYTDMKDPEKAQPYTYKFKYEDRTWKIFSKRDKADEGRYIAFDNDSIAQHVLRVCLPYLSNK